MSSVARIFAILDLFTQARPVWHPDEVNETLGYSRPTGYRYVKELVQAGWLQKVAAGRYALGARIIELDYQLRQSDPVLLAAAPIMEQLVAATGLDVVLSAMFGTHVVDTHRSSAGGGLSLTYGRGRPRPLFRGAAPKVLMAGLGRAPLLRIYKAHAGEIATSGLGGCAAEFLKQLAQIRKQSIYLSRGELDQGVWAAAIALQDRDGDTVAALALVGTEEAMRAQPRDRFREWLQDAARQANERLVANVSGIRQQGPQAKTVKPRQPGPDAPLRSARRLEVSG